MYANGTKKLPVNVLPFPLQIVLTNMRTKMSQQKQQPKNNALKDALEAALKKTANKGEVENRASASKSA